MFNCGAASRIPAERDPRQAKCGKCRQLILTGAPVDVSSAQLDAHRNATKGAAILLDVWAPWCGPCKSMAPQFAAAAKVLEPDVRLLKLNSDSEPAAANALGVSGIPALFLIRDGSIVARMSGAMPASQIIDWTRKALAHTPLAPNKTVHPIGLLAVSQRLCSRRGVQWLSTCCTLGDQYAE